MKKETGLLLLLIVTLGSIEARRGRKPIVVEVEDDADIIEIVAPKKKKLLDNHFIRTISTVEDFERVKKETPLLFTDFWADYCGVCKMMLPDIQELSVEYKDKITFVSVDVGQNKLVPLGRKYAPTSLPTYMLTLGGEKFEILTGSQVKEGLQIYLNKMIKEAEQKGITPKPSAPIVSAVPASKPAVKNGAQPTRLTIETDTPMNAVVVKSGTSTVIELTEK